MENTETLPADAQPDWGLVLPREALHAVIRGLHRSLPSPAADAPEDWARRDRAAMAAVGSLRPANAMEGELAAQIVSARAWASDCLRLAVDHQRDFGAAVRCRAQAVSMMREVKSAWNLLLKVQAARRAIEQDEAASTQAEWTEYAAIGMMAEVLPELARPAAVPEPAPAVVNEIAPEIAPEIVPEIVPEIGSETASEIPPEIPADNVSPFELKSRPATNPMDLRPETRPRSDRSPARKAAFA